MNDSLLRYVISQLIQRPDRLVIKQESREPNETIFIYVDPADMKRIIGKDGKVIKAIRALIGCFGGKRKDVQLDVNRS